MPIGSFCSGAAKAPPIENSISAVMQICVGLALRGCKRDVPERSTAVSFKRKASGQYLLDDVYDARDVVGGKLSFPFCCSLHRIAKHAIIARAAAAACAFLDKPGGCFGP